jgi:predicted house-cleaning noncanonical NTP pyrophosphatase (MazG superfamily)
MNKADKINIVSQNKAVKYNKLVRDKIPEIIIKNSQVPITSKVNEKEFPIYLKNKLLEEIEEFFEEQSIEELADILEIFNAICNHYKFSIDSVEKKRIKKLKTNGGFDKKLILKKVRS